MYAQKRADARTVYEVNGAHVDGDGFDFFLPFVIKHLFEVANMRCIKVCLINHNGEEFIFRGEGKVGLAHESGGAGLSLFKGLFNRIAQGTLLLQGKKALQNLLASARLLPHSRS